MELEVGTKIDITKIGCRKFDPSETVRTLKYYGGWQGMGSWGAKNLTQYNNQVLKMTVSGRVHSGHVYITLNGMDLYDVVLCSNRGTIKKVITDLYFDQLFEVMDREIETPSKY